MMTIQVCLKVKTESNSTVAAPDVSCRTRPGAQETDHEFPLLPENALVLFRTVFSSPVATRLSWEFVGMSEHGALSQFGIIFEGG
ncbi:MAG: hypothetical protein ACPL7J_10110 [Desulfomonilaceae bacterium]